MNMLSWLLKPEVLLKRQQFCTFLSHHCQLPLPRVEQRSGQALFKRSKGKSITVTPFGHRFVTRARKLLQLAAEIEQTPEKADPFIVACFEDLAPWYLAPALDKLTAKFPETLFEGREGRFSVLADDLSEGRSDIAISYDIGFGPDFRRHKIRDVSPVAFLSQFHPLARQSSVELADLTVHPVILFDEDLSEGYIRDMFKNLRLSPNVVHRVSSVEMMRSMAAHGRGIGISYSHPPGNISYDGKPLVTVPISTPEAIARIYLFWSPLRKTDSLFSEILKTLA